MEIHSRDGRVSFFVFTSVMTELLLVLILVAHTITIGLITLIYFHLIDPSEKPKEIKKSLQPVRKGYVIERDYQAKAIKEFTHGNKTNADEEGIPKGE